MHIWYDTLRTITIVTEPGDPACHLASYPTVTIVETDAFTRYGADFNKGAALNYGYLSANPCEWVLMFDADVKPPSNWKDCTTRCIEGELYGARRDGVAQFPLGYFQLFHARDDRVQRWPLFDCRYSHAGCYDMEFVEMWPRHHRHILDLDLQHYSQRRKNWFGPRETDNMKMKRLVDYGILRDRKRPELNFNSKRIQQDVEDERERRHR